jgi:hypothetical protein
MTKFERKQLMFEDKSSVAHQETLSEGTSPALKLDVGTSRLSCEIS